ncbi:hypothetical protein D3C78_1970700 [compost metagenome]
MAASSPLPVALIMRACLKFLTRLAFIGALPLVAIRSLARSLTAGTTRSLSLSRSIAESVPLLPRLL